jgi:chaperonin cofactor prefoldin
MQIAFEGYAYLLIAQRDFTYQEADELKEEVGKILKKRCPKKRFVKYELKRYLDVYDMRIKNPPITYRKIQEKIYPQIKYTKNTLRARINDFNKAKKIINNVEEGKFFYW